MTGSGTLYVFGGTDSTGTLSDTYTLDRGTSAWTLHTPGTSPAARFSMVAGFSGGRFVIAAGEGNSGFFNDVWAFTIGTSTWQQLDTPTDAHPSTR